MKYLWPVFQITLVGFFCMTLAASPSTAQNGASQHRVKSTLKEVWRNGTWINGTKSDYYYDPTGRQSQVHHMRWSNDAWVDTTVVSNSYNAEGLLAEREERQVADGFVLAHELYEYDATGNLTAITFPDTPWFRGRGIFDVHQIPFTTIIFVNPYILTSRILGVQYRYNEFGLLDEVTYTSRGDVIQDSVFVGPKVHDFESKIYSSSEYSPAILTAYRDSLWNLEPTDTREIVRTKKFTYQSNGKQIAVLSHHEPYNAGLSIDLRWDFYDIWHPGEVRTLWFYSDDQPVIPATPFSANQFVVSQFNPSKRPAFFNDLLYFWLSSASDPALYYVYVQADAVQTRHLTSKLQESLSTVNYDIPGNYYQYFYEPRFRQSYPLQDKRLIKSVEQFLLPLQKLSSPFYYGFSWDYNHQWIDSVERNYQYDESGRLTGCIINTWEWDRSGDYNPEEGWWQNDSKYELFYDQAGSGSMVLVSVWDAGTEAWENREMTSFTYEDGSPADIQKSKQFDIRLSNHPNPFNAKTTITFRMESPSVASLKIYDITGRLVRTIINSQRLSAAEHSIGWDGRDENGNTVTTGLYLYQLETETLKKAGRCLYVK